MSQVEDPVAALLCRIEVEGAVKEDRSAQNFGDYLALSVALVPQPAGCRQCDAPRRGVYTARRTTLAQLRGAAPGPCTRHTSRRHIENVFCGRVAVLDVVGVGVLEMIMNILAAPFGSTQYTCHHCPDSTLAPSTGPVGETSESYPAAAQNPAHPGSRCSSWDQASRTSRSHIVPRSRCARPQHFWCDDRCAADGRPE